MSDATLYREFKIDARSLRVIPAALRSFWANAVIPMVTAGRSIIVIFSSEDQKRNAAQNRRLWGYVYKNLAEQGWVNGQQYPAYVWHEYLARLYGPSVELTLPDGEIVTVRKSTTEYTVGEFAAYMNACEVYGAQEAGVVWPA